jgi:hypothetical protein
MVSNRIFLSQNVTRALMVWEFILEASGWTEVERLVVTQWPICNLMWGWNGLVEVVKKVANKKQIIKE